MLIHGIHVHLITDAFLLLQDRHWETLDLCLREVVDWTSLGLISLQAISVIRALSCHLHSVSQPFGLQVPAIGKF